MTSTNTLVLTVSNEIDSIRTLKGLSYIEAIIEYCEEKQVETEYIGNLLKRNQQMTDKIEAEAVSLNFIKKESKLFTE